MYNYQDISKDKLKYISDIIEESKNVNSSNLIPFFLNATKTASEAGISFSDEETDCIIESLKANMTKADQNKIDSIRNMAKLLVSSNS